ncbi:MAG TPA: pirin family protein [Acidimicrobiales bacterium]|nr:pirin family protein [Acidimicrobiales bacterium]
MIDIRTGPERPATRLPWLDSHHSFSFGRHHDPQNTHHGLLLVSNDDVIRAGTGFDTHPHRDMEIVTWVLEGRLEHKDSVGNRGELYPGLAQRMSAGRGIWHSEMNASRGDDVHLVQMWVVPDTESVDASYEQLDINAELARGGLVPIASGRGHDAAIRIRQRGAVLWGGRLQPGEQVTVPDARQVHLYVARGAAQLGDTALATGDAARLTDAGSPQLAASDEGAEVLVWEFA